MSFAQYFETAPLPQDVFINRPVCGGETHVWEQDEDEQHFICSCGAVKQVTETPDRWRHTEILEPIQYRTLYDPPPRCPCGTR